MTGGWGTSIDDFPWARWPILDGGRPELRSLNVAVACAMAVGEALRQTRQN